MIKNLLLAAGGSGSPTPPSPSGPGPTDIIAGDSTAGYYGTVPSSAMISGDALAAAIGLVAGSTRNSAVEWFKFSLDGVTLFTPRQIFRASLNWQSIYQAGAVYGTGTNGNFPLGGNKLQNAQVVIGSYTFKVRLWKGGSADPNSDSSAASAPNSEWNRLMMHMETGSVDPWASYTPAELVDATLTSAGTWCQEKVSIDATDRRITRGGAASISLLGRQPVTTATTNVAWRPLLELVPPII